MAVRKSDENKILIVVGAVVVTIVAAVVWRASHRGENGATRRAQEFAQKWTFMAGPINAGLALADDGTVYAASEDGGLYAIDASGKLRWKANTGATKEAPAIAEDGTIYLANEDQMIYSIGRDGTQKWNWGGGPFANKKSPWRAGALDRDHFYTPWRGQMRAIRLSDGHPDWDAGIGFEDAGTAVLLPGELLVYPGAGRIDASDMQGRTSWQYPVMDPPLTVDYLLEHNGRPPIGNFFLESGMAVDDDGIFYAAATGPKLMAFTPDGAVKWEFKLPPRSRGYPSQFAANYASPVLASDGTVYFVSGEGEVYAFNRDGSQKWTVQLQDPVIASPVLAEDGTLFVASVNAICAFSPAGKILGKTAFREGGFSSPTLASDGTLYVASRSGTIAAYATRHGGLMKSAWPKFQRDVSNTGRAGS